MNIEPIQNGVVIDHIEAGRAMQLYKLLNLGSLDASVALLNNVPSKNMGKNDIIKIDADIDLDFDVIGFVDPSATVVIIRNGELVEKRSIALPEKLTNVIFCKNPRCITSVEQEIDHIFKLSDPDKKEYRCIYCETKYSN